MNTKTADLIETHECANVIKDFSNCMKEVQSSIKFFVIDFPAFNWI